MICGYMTAKCMSVSLDLLTPDLYLFVIEYWNMPKGKAHFLRRLLAIAVSLIIDADFETLVRLGTT